MSDVRLTNHAELLRAIKELRTEWMGHGCPHDLAEGSLFRRLLNLYMAVGMEAEEVAEILDPQVITVKEVA